MTNHLQLAFGGLGPWEIILILAVVLVLFGAKKLKTQRLDGRAQESKLYLCCLLCVDPLL